VDARFGGGDRMVWVETENGGVHSFRITRAVPLEHAQPGEVPQPRLPLPVTHIFGIAATNFHADLITSFEVSLGSNLLATASTDGSACLWNLRPLRLELGPLHQLRHPDIVNCVRFDAAGGRLVTSTADRKVRVWETRTGLPLTDWLQFDEPVNGVAFSPGGMRVITTSGWAWDLHTATGRTPRWLPRLADALADAGEAAAVEQLSALHHEIAAHADPDVSWARRLFEIP
jgi:WD40 repeat protein